MSNNGDGGDSSNQMIEETIGFNYQSGDMDQNLPLVVKLLELLYTLNWPKVPAQPKSIDVGATVEEFIKELVSRTGFSRQEKHVICGDSETEKTDLNKNLNINFSFNDVLELVRKQHSSSTTDDKG